MTPPQSLPPRQGDGKSNAQCVQLVLEYDGAGFSGWQRQPGVPTVQGVMENAVAKLTQAAVPVIAAGRTDAGVHARGQSAGVRVPEKWTAAALAKALNATLPPTIRVKAAHEMVHAFHARYSALSRRYSYQLGLDDDALSPFRRRYEWSPERDVDRAVLDECARAIVGEHSFRAFAVKGTAPEHDQHRCNVLAARWTERPGGLTFEIEANRFLHHMVRYLVGTMVQAATGQRTVSSVAELLLAADNRQVSPPAPAHALFLEQVRYPNDLYLPA